VHNTQKRLKLPACRAFDSALTKAVAAVCTHRASPAIELDTQSHSFIRTSMHRFIRRITVTPPAPTRRELRRSAPAAAFAEEADRAGLATHQYLRSCTDSILKYHTKSSGVSTGRRHGDTQKIIWKSGMCRHNRGLNSLLWKSLLKISDVYTGSVENDRREGVTPIWNSNCDRLVDSWLNVESTGALWASPS
jgi:hypothetical protein